jgi:hypothetical protein
MIQRHHHGIRTALAGAAAAAALLCAAPARAAIIDFSSLAPSAHTSGVTLSEHGYQMDLLEGPVGAFYGVTSATGTIANGDDPATCDVTACPAGAHGNYLMVLNDGAVRFSRGGAPGGFRLSGLDLAFLAPLAVPGGNFGMLRLSGTALDGSIASLQIDFPGQNAAGDFVFGAAAIAYEFRRLTLSSLTIDACLFDADSNCVNSLDNPAFNQAQFALDNVRFREVPEPGTLLLAGLGAGALALQRRRQRGVRKEA